MIKSQAPIQLEAPRPSGVYIQPHAFLPIFKLGKSINFINRTKQVGGKDMALERGYLIPTVDEHGLEKMFKSHDELSAYKIENYFTQEEVQSFLAQSNIKSLTEWYSMDGFSLCMKIAREQCDVVLPTVIPQQALAAAVLINKVNDFVQNLKLSDVIYRLTRSALENDFYQENTKMFIDKFFNENGQVRRIEITLKNFKFSPDESRIIKEELGECKEPSSDVCFLNSNYHRVEYENYSLRTAITSEVFDPKLVDWGDLRHELGIQTTIDFTFNESLHTEAISQIYEQWVELQTEFNKSLERYMQPKRLSAQ